VSSSLSSKKRTRKGGTFHVLTASRYGFGSKLFSTMLEAKDMLMRYFGRAIPQHTWSSVTVPSSYLATSSRTISLRSARVQDLDHFELDNVIGTSKRKVWPANRSHDFDMKFISTVLMALPAEFRGKQKESLQICYSKKFK
jgi:hypothetical protein